MSRRLHALYVGNFKAFADTQTIPIKPITLVFGPNSSGKSSFIHSLALAHEAQFGREKQGRARLDVHHTEVGGNAIDLGGFRQYVHRGQLRNGVEWGVEIKTASLGNEANFRQLASLLAPVKMLKVIVRLGIKLNQYDKPTNDAVPRVESIEIRADDEDLLYLTRRDETGSAMRILRIATENPVFQTLIQAVIEGYTTTTEIRDGDMVAASEAIAELLPDLVVRMGAFLPKGVELPRSEFDASTPQQMLFPVSKGNRAEDIAQAIRFQLPRSLNELIRGVADVVAGELHGLKYLGPLRDVPPRHVAFQQHQDENWVSGGKFAWELLRKDEELRERVNQWLAGHPGISTKDVDWETTEAALMDRPTPRAWMKTPYRLEIGRFYSVIDLKDPLTKAFMDRPLTLLERRQMLTKDLAEVMYELQEQYEMKQARIEEETALLGPWIERIQSATNSQEREALIAEASRALAGDKSADWEAIRVEQQIEQIPYEEAMGKSSDFLESLHEQGDIAISELLLLDVRKRTPVSLRDVGVGISQVLPVLALAYGSRQQLVAIEQPEIHLHPALQAELGDVFIESALGDRENTFILETHSEHLVLRLLRRIRETTEKSLKPGEFALTPDDVAILYINPSAAGSEVVVIPITHDGDFSRSWPEGFFTDREKELF
ncbi:DUF3696 domain-containing protein [Rudaea sp.]|uniref:AAA family ATPase n=1 Tax=Rudaea sp. TaxID=2136325 RepID=UPI0032202687